MMDSVLAVLCDVVCLGIVHLIRVRLTGHRCSTWELKKVYMYFNLWPQVTNHHLPAAVLESSDWSLNYYLDFIIHPEVSYVRARAGIAGFLSRMSFN